MTTQEQAGKLEVSSPIGEAGLSVNWSMTDGFGLSVQFTGRGATFDEIEALLAKRKAFIMRAQETGWTIPGRVAPPMQAAAPAPQAAPRPAPPAASPIPAPPNGHALSFPAQTLVGSVTNGKTYWKVKGGRFTQHGVTIWPEVLDAAGFGTLDPMTPGGYPLNGWTAHYVEKEPGKPDKVTQLTA